MVSSDEVPKKVAVIIAGAVAKGAYAAGVLHVLARKGFEVKRLVAASSGSLNAAMYASYVRRGDEVAGANELVEMWLDHAGFWDVFSLDMISVFRLEGVSSPAKVRRLLRSKIQAGEIPNARPVSLRMLVAPLTGVDCQRIDEIAHSDDRERLAPAKDRTTYEYVCDFNEADFDTDAGRDGIVEAALASSAFPFVFQPVHLEGIGPCIDGGAVNNAPIKWALGGDIGAELDAVFVIAPTPAHDQCPSQDLRGARLIGQAAAMLINERLYRDIREAERVNMQLKALEDLEQRGVLSPIQAEEVKRALGWSHMKRAEIVQIRPNDPLDGSSFSGFADRALREHYIEAGMKRAEEVFKAEAWLLQDRGPRKLRAV